MANRDGNTYGVKTGAGAGRGGAGRAGVAGRTGPGGGVGRRAVAAAAVLGGAVALTGRSPAWAAPRPGSPVGAGAAGGLRLRLPAPSGPYRIGASVLHLVDHKRPDPWLGAGSVRQVMATVWYPAGDVRGRPRLPHMTPRAAGSFASWAPRTHPQVPPTGVDWAATATHAHLDAPALTGRRRPVLLYSPGGGDPRTLGTCVAEELASHGFVVVTLDHPGDASEVELPDGTLRETVFIGDPRADPKLFRTVIETRLADVRLVLDHLGGLAGPVSPATGRRRDQPGGALPRGLARALDPHRVGVYGHSAGGTTAAQALYDDRRIAAAANLEGYLSHPGTPTGRPGPLFPVARDGVDRPLLLLGTDGFRNAEFERTWSAAVARSHGHAAWRQIAGATHATLTDYAALAPQLQAAGLITAEARAGLVGTIDPARSVPLLRHLVRTFFARHLGTP
ncbi:alpha/beta hydrolase family protein [Streptomyces buecherae]|uniref:Alpha/beta hydrolase n=1 Tax=Streptomyces buecherae TaxID=2763006 RepID=A0A7H8N5R9_9ACTN|nr:alpha/beta hydrolase [Streptomyces buecherae]QKW49857.1 alpha/beta hydrolase [Streptomyces buecherae]